MIPETAAKVEVVNHLLRRFAALGRLLPGPNKFDQLDEDQIAEAALVTAEMREIKTQIDKIIDDAKKAAAKQ